MSYLIRYEGKEPKRYNHQRYAGWFLCIIVLAVCFLAGNVYHDDWKGTLQQFFMPGSTESTVVLLEDAVSQIRQGENIADVLDAFCREVITVEN